MGDTPPVYCKGFGGGFFLLDFFNAANTAKSLYQKNRVTKYERDTIKLYIRIILA